MSLGKFILGIVIGAAAGYIGALLLTPKSGENVRNEIRGSFEEIKLDYEQGKQQKRESLEQEIRRRWGEID